MIIDHLDNAERYYALSADLEAGLRFLKTADLKNLPLGKNKIKGDRLFALISEYTTKDEAAAGWEAHRKYIDIQFLARGTETIAYQCVSRLEVVTPYDPAQDAVFLRGRGNQLVVPSDFFAVFFPPDAHQPGLHAGRPQAVRKIVLKVRAN